MKHFFVLSELQQLYESRLKDLGLEKSTNHFRLKKHILEEFPDAQEQNNGKHTVIAFNAGLKGLLKDVLKERDFSDDTLLLAKATKVGKIYSYTQDFLSLVHSRLDVKKMQCLQV